MGSRIDMQTHAGRIPIAKVKTLTRGLRLVFDLWTFNLRVSARRDPAMDYMSTDFGAVKPFFF